MRDTMTISNDGIRGKTVYALIGTFDYEGDTLISLHSTKEEAEFRKAKEIERQDISYDDYRIDPMIVY
jgi:hypothetical protein